MNRIVRRLTAVIEHPVTRWGRRIVRLLLLTIAVVVAAALVTAVSIDLGPTAKQYAEKYGGQYLERPLHIGRIRFRLYTGNFLFEDLVIEGITPESRPFLTAKRVELSMPWSTLFDKRIVLQSIEMDDWQMYIEVLKNGKSSLPRLTPRNSSGRKSSWTTTLQWVRASRGAFTFEDHATPWHVITRNLNVIVAKPSNEYRGQASFSNGEVGIQEYVPFRADMNASFKIDGSRVLLDHIEMITDGARSLVHGDVNLKYWPEQSFRVESTFDMKRMRELFFAKEQFALSGTGRFEGYFHLFKEPRPDGTNRTGRELVGTFASARAGVRAGASNYRFDDLRGSVRWTPEALSVTDASASLYGGRANFAYEMSPLGQRDVRTTARFSAQYANLRMSDVTNFADLNDLRIAGTASGRVNLQWPLGRFAQRRIDGDLHVMPPDDIELMTRRVPVELIDAGRLPRGPAAELGPRIPLALGADVTFSTSGTGLTLGPSTVRTPRTYVELEGDMTTSGREVRLPFFVASADWQESYRVFAAMMTGFGVRTTVQDVGGYGTFEGILLDDIRKPRIEGTFAGEHMRAFDVDWGSARGRAVIENSYADVAETTITSGESTIDVDGRFSLGFPRKDEGEEINARVRLNRKPITDLKHAFSLDRYAVDGVLSGEFHVFGNYRTPLGYGSVQLDEGNAYGETFQTATASVGLEGNGVRLTAIDVTKSTGRGTGAAYVGWDATYSFDFEAKAIPVEDVALVSKAPLPLSGLVDFTANGSGTFDHPRYNVSGHVRDLFAADEGIGELVGDLTINDETMMIAAKAASPRLAVAVDGTIELAESYHSDLTFTVSDTSLDPYVRALDQRLSPFTTAVVDGTVRVRGELAKIDELQVDTTIDRLDLRLFDYGLRNKAPFQVIFDHNSVSIPEECDSRAPAGDPRNCDTCGVAAASTPQSQPQGTAPRWCGLTLSGEDVLGQQTELRIGGAVNLGSRQILMAVNGTANLAVLQGFVSNVKSTGNVVLKAVVSGNLDDPSVTGSLAVENGRIRHFGAPHALESLSGAIAFDTRGVTLDGLTARIGGGPVQFGGRIEKVGYLPGRLEVTMSGQNMRVRYPEGMQSTLDADLTLQGTLDDMRLGGDVTIRDALYSKPLPTNVFELLNTETALPGVPGQTVPLTYDNIRIIGNSSIRVQNTGDNSARLSASAELELRGTYDRPILAGDVEIDPGGELRLLGKRYTVTQGTVYFANPNAIEPSFDLEAETRVRVPGETYRITANVSGKFGGGTTPRLSFDSDPSLSNSEIFALLISDVAPGQNPELSRVQGDNAARSRALQDALAQQAISPISSQVNRAFENVLGVDTVQITPSLANPNPLSSRLEPCARLVIAKRLSPQGNLTYSRSLCSNSRDEIIYFEYDATDRFSWVLSRNEDQTYAIEVRVRRSF